jgi:thioredoxin 1
MSNVEVFMFSSTTCAPCKNVKPYIAELEEDYSHYSWTHVDINDNPALTTKMGVTNIPCMVVTKGGDTVGTHKGTMVMGYLMLLKKAR